MLKNASRIALMAFAATAALAQGPTATHLDGEGVVGDQGPRVIVAGPTILWDNGDTDGSRAISNATQDVFGARRTVLDDFEIPTGEQWSIDDLHWIHTWDTLPPGSGTGVELTFHNDVGDAPDPAPLATANVTTYTEEASGRIFFSRAEAESWADFDSIVLGEGAYWIQATIVGPENNFWMGKSDPSHRLNQCWTNYEDLPPLQPCFNTFGVIFDLSWYLTGEIDGGGCRLQVRTRRRARAGRALPVDLRILHNRAQTVAVPFVLSVEDRFGTVVTSHTTAPFTMSYGQQVQAVEWIDLPTGMAPGRYDLVVSMDEMRGGREVATRRFMVR